MLAENTGRNFREVGDEPALTTIRASVHYYGLDAERLPQARNIGITMRTKNLLSMYENRNFTATRGITNAQMV